MSDLGAQLVEILSLRRLQGLRDQVQCLVLRRIGVKFGSGGFPVGIDALPSSAIALRPETAEPDAGFLLRAATDEAGGPGLQADAEDFRDALEILVDSIIPVMVETALAILGAGTVLGALGKFIDPIDGRCDHLGHERVPVLYGLAERPGRVSGRGEDQATRA